MEGPLVNQTDGLVCLSKGAGCFEKLQDQVVPLESTTPRATAETLESTLALVGSTRGADSDELRSLIRQNNPELWLEDQLAQLSS